MNDDETPLHLIQNILHKELELDSHPDVNTFDLCNFLDSESKEKLGKMISDYLNCGAMDTDHVFLYDTVRFAYGEENYLAGIDEDHEGESEEKRQDAFTALKYNILKHIKNELAHLRENITFPLLFSPMSLGEELISAVESEKRDFHAIYNIYYFTWRSFCQDYIRISYCWSATGALLYGPHQKEQMKLFLYKTQGVWVGNNDNLLKVKSSYQFSSKYKEFRKAKSILLRLFT